MKSSKLIDILRSLSPAEMKNLAAFIEKQLDKKDTLPQKLFLLIEKYYPQLEAKDIRKEKIYAKVFPKQAYNENKFSKLMSELAKIIENYIIFSHRQEDHLEDKMHLLKYYFERNLDKYFIITAREIRAILENIPMGSRQNIFKYQFEELMTTYALKIDNRNGDYEKVYAELNEFIQGETLRWKNLSLIDPVPLQAKEQAGQPFYLIHHRLNLMLTTHEEKYFFEVMDDIENHIKLFAQEESREILKMLLYFAIQKINKGFADYYEQQLRIYHILIDRDLILNHYGKIYIATYKNYISSALRLGRIAEAEKFLEHYKHYLLDDLKEDVYNFNKAFIRFEKNNFDEVLSLLSNTKLDDVYYNLAQRRMVIKAYYELLQKDNSYFELLHSSMNAFKKFVYTKNSIPELHVELNKNFLKMLQKIEEISGVNKTKVAALQKELKAMSSVAERQWLENKISLLL